MSSEYEQIKAVNHHLRLAIDQVDNGVVILGASPLQPPGPSILFVNHALCKITGYSRSDLLNKPISKLYPEDNLKNLLDGLPTIAEAQRLCHMESVILCADGTTKDAVWTVSSVCDAEGVPLNFTITVREREEELPVAATATRNNLASLSEEGRIQASKMESLAFIASGIAHDYNNVLTTILMNLSMARMEGDLSLETDKHLGNATKAAESAQQLSKQLLAFAKGGKPVKIRMDLGNILKESSRITSCGSNVTCQVTVDPELWSVEADATQVLQVSNNLLINARQAMPTGGVIQAHVENMIVPEDTELDLAPGDYVTIRVRDRGKGISDEDLKKIFDPFFTTKEEGSGLGLATCYSIVREHEGLIVVHSKEGLGTEFTVFLPALKVGVEVESVAKNKEVEEAPAPKSQQGFLANIEEPSGLFAAAIEKAESAGVRSVLVVDDQESVRSVAAEMIAKLGYRVDSAVNGQEALKMYHNRYNGGDPFAVVLMDMTLPGGMSGTDTLNEIMELDPGARTIATSGYFDEATHDHYREIGFVGILPKPYSVEKLSKALEDAIMLGSQ